MPINVQCPSCGQPYSLDDAFAGKRAKCSACGAIVDVPMPVVPVAPPAGPAPYHLGPGHPPAAPVSSTSGLAVSALVLAIVPLCLTQVLGIVLGIVALFRIRSSDGRLKGQGLAVSGIIVGVAWGVLQLGLIVPAVFRAREAARTSACQCNLKQIGLAFHMYCSDYDEYAPCTTSNSDQEWYDLLKPYTDGLDAFCCPANDASTPDNSYVYMFSDRSVRIYQIRRPSETIVVYETSPGAHRGGRNVLFVDGHVEWMIEDRFARALEETEIKPGSGDR